MRPNQFRLPWRIASGSRQPMCAQCRHGKESVANSHPPFGPCSAVRPGGDFLFAHSGQQIVVFHANTTKMSQRFPRSLCAQTPNAPRYTNLCSAVSF